jgi:hypothetical protein
VLIEQFTKIKCSVKFDTTVFAELFELTRFRVPPIRAKAQKTKNRPLSCSPSGYRRGAPIGGCFYKKLLELFWQKRIS